MISVNNELKDKEESEKEYKTYNISNEIKNNDASESDGKGSGKEDNTYECKICNKESKNSVDAMTHLIDHASSSLEAVNTLLNHTSSALEAVNALIKDQKIVKVSTKDKKRIPPIENKTNVQKDKEIIVTQEVQ
jgi:hypothetical protein